MAVNFPNSPPLDSQFSAGDRTWLWNGTYWEAISTTVGYTGSTGTQGVTGFTGSQGIPGDYAALGYTGSTGTQGVIGFTGSTGTQGNIGFTGSTGTQGVIGFTGSASTITGYTGSLGYVGSVAFVYGLNVASLDNEILADSPYGYWKLSETLGTIATNFGSGAQNMTYAGAYTLAYSAAVPTSTDKYPLMTGTANASVAGQLGLTVPVTGDWTIEGIVVPYLDGTNLTGILTMAGVGETLATNFQFQVYLLSTGEAAVFWEYGAGTNQIVYSGYFATSGRPLHVVSVKNSTAKTITFYFNGVKGLVQTYATEPGGGTSASTYIGPDGTNTTNSPAIRAHIAYYTTQLSEARVQVHAKAAGLYSVGYVTAATVTGYNGSLGYTGSAGFTGSVGFVGSQSTASGYTGSIGGFNSIQELSVQTGTAYTLVLNDTGELVRLNNTQQITLTVPTESTVAFAIGQRIDVQQLNIGSVVVVGASGVVINSTDYPILNNQFSIGTLIKTGSNEWNFVTPQGTGYSGSVGYTGSQGAGYAGSAGYTGSVGGFGSVQELNAQTGTAYTLVINDAGDLIRLNNTQQITVTVPLESSVAFTIGQRIDVQQLNIGGVIVQGAAGVVINSTDYPILNNQFSIGTLIKTGSNEWNFVTPAGTGYTGSVGYVGSQGSGYVGSTGYAGSIGGFNSVQELLAFTATNYTFSLTDAGDLIRMNTTQQSTVTIPLESSVAFAIGQRIDVQQVNIGSVVLVGAAGVTLVSTDYPILNSQYSVATVIKTGSNEWLFVGPQGTGYTGSIGYTGSASTVTGYTGSVGSVSAAASLTLSSSTLSTAVVGRLEYDGKVPYFTPQYVERGLLPSKQFFRANANITGSTSTTAQSLFGVGVTLSTSTVYAFEMYVYMGRTGGGATSHTISLGFGGTATINNIQYYGNATATAAVATVVGLTAATTSININTTASTVVSAALANAASVFLGRIVGTVSINAGGTFIPQYTLSAAFTVAYSVYPGSFIQIYPISTSGANTSVGTWA